MERSDTTLFFIIWESGRFLLKGAHASYMLNTRRSYKHTIRSTVIVVRIEGELYHIYDFVDVKQWVIYFVECRKSAVKRHGWRGYLVGYIVDWGFVLRPDLGVVFTTF